MVEIEQLLSCCPTNKPNYEQLLQLLSKRVVIPFVGAGFSANMKYPSWNSFLKTQAEQNCIPEISSLLEKNEFEKAASLLEKKLHRNGLENIMLQTFGNHVYRNHGIDPAFESFSRLFQGAIITTNFDGVIETLHTKVTGEYLDKITPKSSKDSKVISQKLAYGEPLLIKLHGDVANREYVLTEEEYNNVYGIKAVDCTLPMPSVLKNILSNRTLLFLGCSLESDRTLKVIEQAKDEGVMSFAILPLPESTHNNENPMRPRLEENGKENVDFSKRKEFLANNNIIPIWYPYDQFECLKTYLQNMEQATVNKYQINEIMTQKRITDLIEKANEKVEHNEIAVAYYLYSEIEELLKIHQNNLAPHILLEYLNYTYTFYAQNGYIYEKKGVLTDLIIQTKKNYGKNSLELIRLYQIIAYSFERYQYYGLMQKVFCHSHRIMEEYEKQENSLANYKNSLLNAKSFLYINLAYGYLKTNQHHEAKHWYSEAENLLEYSKELTASNRAFLYNGLYRFYDLDNKYEKALETLNNALEIRRKLCFSENKVSYQHIVNTHSNKIRIYLKGNYNLTLAEKEYQECMNEPEIATHLKQLPEARHRILTDYGDIQIKKQQYDEALNAYRSALAIRKELLLSDNLSSAELYQKIAATYRLKKQYDEALEYFIQSYVVYENILGEDDSTTKSVLEELNIMKDLMKIETIDSRLKIQKELCRFHIDNKLKNHEKLKKEAAQNSKLQPKDIHPTECAPVLVASDSNLR